MKKLIVLLMTAMMSLTFNITSAAAAPSVVIEKTADTTETRHLISRLKQIDAMDKSQLTRKEKKELRSEVKEIDKRLREIAGGVYISVGALILILVLLIILL
jgi:hypothetical protein